MLERLKLCDHCRPQVAALIEYERAHVAARQARDKLMSVSGIDEPRRGRRPNSTSADDDLDERQSAIHATKQRLGIQRANPAPETMTVNPRWMKDVAIDEIMRVIRGEISPGDLCKELRVSSGVVRSRVSGLIGPPAGPERWRKGVGYLRFGKPAWDPEHQRIVVKPPPPRERKPSQPRGPYEKRGPKMSLPTSALKQLAAGTLAPTVASKRFNMKRSTVYYLMNKYKAEMADSGSSEPKPEPKADPKPEPKADPPAKTHVRERGRISPLDHERLLAKTRSVAQVAHKYSISETKVRAQYAEYIKAQREREPATTPANGASQLTTDEVVARVLAEPARMD